ncbi:hypothetical protein Tco_0552957 [Tanacetum coccineum]
MTQLRTQTPQVTFSKKALIIPKPFIPFKYYGFNDNHFDEYEYYPGCDICGSIAHETYNCDKKALPSNRRPRIASQQSKEPIEKWVHKRNYRTVEEETVILTSSKFLKLQVTNNQVV